MLSLNYVSKETFCKFLTDCESRIKQGKEEYNSEAIYFNLLDLFANDLNTLEKQFYLKNFNQLILSNDLDCFFTSIEFKRFYEEVLENQYPCLLENAQKYIWRKQNVCTLLLLLAYQLSEEKRIFEKNALPLIIPYRVNQFSHVENKEDDLQVEFLSQKWNKEIIDELKKHLNEKSNKTNAPCFSFSFLQMLLSNLLITKLGKFYSCISNHYPISTQLITFERKKLSAQLYYNFYCKFMDKGNVSNRNKDLIQLFLFSLENRLQSECFDDEFINPFCLYCFEQEISKQLSEISSKQERDQFVLYLRKIVNTEIFNAIGQSDSQSNIFEGFCLKARQHYFNFLSKLIKLSNYEINQTLINQIQHHGNSTFSNKKKFYIKLLGFSQSANVEDGCFTYEQFVDGINKQLPLWTNDKLNFAFLYTLYPLKYKEEIEFKIAHFFNIFSEEFVHSNLLTMAKNICFTEKIKQLCKKIKALCRATFPYLSDKSQLLCIKHLIKQIYAFINRLGFEKTVEKKEFLKEVMNTLIELYSTHGVDKQINENQIALKKFEQKFFAKGKENLGIIALELLEENFEKIKAVDIITLLSEIEKEKTLVSPLA